MLRNLCNERHTIYRRSRKWLLPWSKKPKKPIMICHYPHGRFKLSFLQSPFNSLYIFIHYTSLLPSPLNKRKYDSSLHIIFPIHFSSFSFIYIRFSSTHTTKVARLMEFPFNSFFRNNHWSWINKTILNFS